MYNTHFGFVELPFSIVPNSRFLFLSQRHKEAIYHLQAGLGNGGGFAMLTGEVGTGKTTVARAMLKALDSKTQTGLILNPTFSNIELLEAICDEFAISYEPHSSLKVLASSIQRFLLDSYAQGRQTLLVIDEAQHLSAEVLEQLRLLTNLETESQKLLKVLLIGQPELQHKLQMPQLRQLAQRITGRYHLLPLSIDEATKYIQFRLQLAGGQAELFNAKSLKLIGQETLGIPRLINLVCDGALKRAFSLGESTPSYETVHFACHDVMSLQYSFQRNPSTRKANKVTRTSALIVSALMGLSLAWASVQFLPALIQPSVQKFVESRYPEKPNVSVEEEVFGQDFQALLAMSADLPTAISELYKVWGYHASVLDGLCLPNEQGMFQCEEKSGSLDQVAKANFPIVLTLELAGKKSYAVLYHLSSDKVQLLVGGERIELDKTNLNAIWHGEYHLIWQRLWFNTLKPGMSGHHVASLDYQLSEILDQPLATSDVYGAELKRKVELFQRWQGLDVDGIAGKKTLQRLELLSQEYSPKLTQTEKEV